MKKKIIATLLCASFVMGLAACGEDTSGSPDINVKVEAPEGEKTEDSHVGEGLMTLGAYTGLTVQASKHTATVDEVDQYAQYLFNMEASSITWNKEAEIGDTVVMDFVGKLNGEAFAGGSAEDYSIILGSHTFIDGFEDGMIGMKPGDVWDLDLTFPEDYGNEELNGQAVVFTVTCKNVIPTISDENVATLQNDKYSNEEEFLAEVRKVLDEYNEEDFKSSAITMLIDQIMSTSIFGDLTDEMMDEQKEALVTTYGSAAESMGVDLETYFKNYGTDIDTMAGLFVKRDLIFKEIAAREGISVDDAELDATVKEMIDEFYAGSTMTPEDFYAETDKEEYRYYVLTEKVYDFLIENNNVEAQDDTVQ